MAATGTAAAVDLADVYQDLHAHQTGLDYASTATGVDSDGHDVPLMHACGHDMHVLALREELR